jgi:hypothetical protein
MVSGEVGLLEVNPVAPLASPALSPPALRAVDTPGAVNDGTGTIGTDPQETVSSLRILQLRPRSGTRGAGQKLRKNHAGLSSFGVCSALLSRIYPEADRRQERAGIRVYTDQSVTMNEPRKLSTSVLLTTRS